MQSADTGADFGTPGKDRHRNCPKRYVDDFTKNALRNLIYEWHRKSGYPQWEMVALIDVGLSNH